MAKGGRKDRSGKEDVVPTIRYLEMHESSLHPRLFKLLMKHFRKYGMVGDFQFVCDLLCFINEEVRKYRILEDTVEDNVDDGDTTENEFSLSL